MNNINNKINGIRTEMIVNNDEDLEAIDEENNENLEFENEDLESENDDSFNKDDNNNKEIKNDELKKKMIKLMVIIGAVMIIFLLILFIISLFSKSTYSYESVENIMKEAAQKYFEEHKANLPIDENQTVEIDVKTLVAGEYMKDLSKYRPEACSGNVQVKKSGSTYTYTANLNCGEAYSTKFLADEVINDSNLVSSGYGLYAMNDSYVFRGEKVNNYVQMDAKLWRIVKVNSDKTIMLILDDILSAGGSYDNRYNTEVKRSTGYNNYLSSRLKEKLDDVYSIKNDKNINYILSENDKDHLVNFDLCIGKKGTSDTNNTNSLECTQTTSQKIGLLTLSDYLNASIDLNCKSSKDKACKNYNYLATSQYSFWLCTGSTSNSYTAYSVNNGLAEEYETSYYSNLRPVITLSANTLIKDGNGSMESPYLLK